MTTFLIADNHFGHSAIIAMCNRPFSDVCEMDDAMIAGWNAVVRPGDTVIHLGDFAHRIADIRLPKIFGALNGKKHLIKGNHDGRETLQLPWQSVNDVMHTSIDSTAVTLCHYAWRVWPRQRRRGALMLFGHSHGRLPGNQQSMDVGVDVLGFSPVRLNTIKSYLAALPALADPEGGDEFKGDKIGGLKP
jgi:calcineurin-like phosphoesterase family protein